MGNSRSFGLEGAGKGDGDRTCDKDAFDKNMDEVNFPHVPASQDPSFQKTKRGYVKVYGQREEPICEIVPLPDIEPAPAQSPNEIPPEL